jgi:hypothetical protein
MVPSSGSRCPGPSVVSWTGTRLAARAEMPMPAATAAMRPFTPRQTHALRYGRAHPDQAVPLDELAAFLAGGPLADEHVELVSLQALMQQAALVDRQIEVNERVVPAEVVQDLGQAGQGEVVGDADTEPPARPGSAEVRGRLLESAEDVTRESDHRFAVGRQ